MLSGSAQDAAEKTSFQRARGLEKKATKIATDPGQRGRYVKAIKAAASTPDVVFQVSRAEEKRTSTETLEKLDQSYEACAIVV